MIRFRRNLAALAIAVLAVLVLGLWAVTAGSSSDTASGGSGSESSYELMGDPLYEDQDGVSTMTANISTEATSQRQMEEVGAEVYQDYSEPERLLLNLFFVPDEHGSQSTQVGNVVVEDEVIQASVYNAPDGSSGAQSPDSGELQSPEPETEADDPCAAIPEGGFDAVTSCEVIETDLDGVSEESLSYMGVEVSTSDVGTGGGTGLADELADALQQAYSLDIVSAEVVYDYGGEPWGVEGEHATAFGSSEAEEAYYNWQQQQVAEEVLNW